jgi:hypothetical protein
MNRFSARLFALGLALGALGAAAVLTAGAYARTTVGGPVSRARNAGESGRPVIDWNQVLLSIVNTPGAQPANIQPTRNFAILHAAIFDAVNAIDRTHEPYLISVRAPRDASETAAADAAAHMALVRLYPAQQTTLDADYAAELSKVANGRAKEKGVRLGEQVAGDLLAIRANDGSEVTPPPFVAGTGPGDYRSTPPNFPTPIFTTWGRVTPFVLDRGDQFRPAPPPAVTSDAYAAAINEVQSLGSTSSTTRTAEQTEIGKFWHPPIQNFWNQIAETVALAHHSDLPTTARLFAALNLSFADSRSPSMTPSTHTDCGGRSRRSASPTVTAIRTASPTRTGSPSPATPRPTPRIPAPTAPSAPRALTCSPGSTATPSTSP